jgi:hypothetical protein
MSGRTGGVRVDAQDAPSRLAAVKTMAEPREGIADVTETAGVYKKVSRGRDRARRDKTAAGGGE